MNIYPIRVDIPGNPNAIISIPIPIGVIIVKLRERQPDDILFESVIVVYSFQGNRLMTWDDDQERTRRTKSRVVRE